VHRFFVPAAALAQQPVVLTGDQAHQIRRVLRIRMGERVTLLDGQGWAHEGILVAVDEAAVRFQTLHRWEAAGEPRTHITLYQAALKGERFGWALQKGVEVGVSAFAPLICERNVVDDLAAVEGKRERWERIIREAAEQCGRGRLPELRPAQLFSQAMLPTPPRPRPARARGDALASPARACPELLEGRGTGGEVRLIAWEGEHSTTLRDALAGCNWAAGARIQVFVGPEGGFTEDEIALARRCGVQPITLGPRILRAETAGVIAAALILYQAGEL
jgi:16S rRNA (uracil1498-N3)-methyltransferase